MMMASIIIPIAIAIAIAIRISDVIIFRYSSAVRFAENDFKDVVGGVVVFGDV